ncbi:hypothetical protein CDV55_104799 [Aspergillus turcosus]|nr:hypothetical protein CDV55_104799 [Aspergillus turcosus]
MADSIMFPLIILMLGAIAWRMYTSFKHLSTIPKEVPWVGRTGTFSSYLTSQIKAIRNTPSAINEAYNKYNKNGAICAIPLPFSRPEILVPRSFIRWMISQGDAILSPLPVQDEIVGPKYVFLNPSVHGDYAVYKVLRANLNRQLPKLIPAIMEELAARVDQFWGMDTDWREVQSHPLVRNVVGRVSGRIILGSPLCYDEELLDNLSYLANCVFPSALLLRFFPPFLHPLLAHLTTIVNRIYKRKTLKVLKPYIEQQIDVLQNDMIRGQKTVHRNDILTWVIADALRRNEPRKGLVDRICCRVFTVIFAAIETTTLTMSNTVLDLCASDPSLQVWEGLAEEGHRMFSSCAGNAPDQALVNSLVRADSALKETLRLRTSIKALAMQVTAPGGITLNGGNLRLPQGSRLSVSSWGIHHDEEIYPSASTFDAFRFSRPREGGETADAATNDNDNKHLMVSVSETYLPFGMGRHSCPGRYFAAIELKLFLAYLAVNYDIKLADERPAFVSIGHFPMPPLNGKLVIRRRRGTAKVGVEDPTRA